MIKLCIGCCIALVGVNLCAQNKNADVVSSGVEMVRSGVADTLSAAADAVDPSAPNMFSLEMKEEKFFENLEARKKAVLDFVNKHVSKQSNISEVDAMKEDFEKTATNKIRRYKYNDGIPEEETGEKEENRP